MKTKKLLINSLPIMAFAPLTFFIVSCSNNQSNEEKIKINKTKDKLNKFISENLESISDENNIKIYNESNSKEINLFQSLIDNSLISQNFYFDNSLITKPNNTIVNFEFSYNTKDSYGQILRPTLSANNSSIEIPVLIYYYDLELKTQVSKYINLFTLSVVDSIVDDEVDKGYNGQNGKTIIFKDNQFQTIPKIMIDKYLEFVNMINEPKQEYRKYPIYQSKSSELKEWNGKTLSEVKNDITDSIKNPSDYIYDKNEYYYSIQNQYFYGEGEWKYAYFVINIQLRPKENVSLINDAKNIYGLKFDKTYSIVDKRWAFEQPSSNDINLYVSNNEKICNEFINEAKNNTLLYVPIINISPWLIYNEKYKAIDFVERFNKGIKNDFLAPYSFQCISSKEEIREISFSIESLEVVESFENRIKINLKMNVDKGKLMTSKEFSKTFDLETWNFV